MILLLLGRKYFAERREEEKKNKNIYTDVFSSKLYIKFRFSFSPRDYLKTVVERWDWNCEQSSARKNIYSEIGEERKFERVLVAIRFRPDISKRGTIEEEEEEDRRNDWGTMRLLVEERNRSYLYFVFDIERNRAFIRW